MSANAALQGEPILLNVLLNKCSANSWFALWEENAQNQRIIAHFVYFFTCHCSKIVWLTENLNEIKITHDDKIFCDIKQKFSHFEKWFGNMLTKKTFFYVAKITVIFSVMHRIKSKPKNNYKKSNYQTHWKSSFKRNYFQWI